MSYRCASCGKADANLKACKACKLVKYCGVVCQVAHRAAHKKECKKKARELFDAQLYAQPPRQEECPICMIPLPLSDDKSVYMNCCGKIICQGCIYYLTRDCCPFCITVSPRTDEEIIKRVSNRIEKYNDPKAMIVMSGFYRNGWHGLPVDQSKEIELVQRACELGSASGHFDLAIYYDEGVGAEQDKKKALLSLSNCSDDGTYGCQA
eukprot:scaffold186627_cov20-Cyclotella_meneghiniana.AAC.2